MGHDLGYREAWMAVAHLSYEVQSRVMICIINCTNPIQPPSRSHRSQSSNWMKLFKTQSSSANPELNSATQIIPLKPRFGATERLPSSIFGTSRLTICIVQKRQTSRTSVTKLENPRQAPEKSPETQIFCTIWVMEKGFAETRTRSAFCRCATNLLKAKEVS